MSCAGTIPSDAAKDKSTTVDRAVGNTRAVERGDHGAHRGRWCLLTRGRLWVRFLRAIIRRDGAAGTRQDRR